ncbi:MAG TPA: DNA-3-methyladenine glycosylase [Longimicrobiales bacterium]|nr:DNA-3-methyladenine glycosylase [Longimicrobiales bacterium]
MTGPGIGGASARRGHVGALVASWYARAAEIVARDLLGAVITSTIDDVFTAGRIVETEAYVGPHDDASHAAERIGRTHRNDAMYGTPGIAYVYRIYGIHWCLNVVTNRVDYPAAVLIRAVEPVTGIEHMRARRTAGQKRLPDTALTNGPGKLAAAFGITGHLNEHPLDRPPLYITAGERLPDDAITSGPRIGITRAADWPLRFWENRSAWVSR